MGGGSSKRGLRGSKNLRVGDVRGGDERVKEDHITAVRHVPSCTGKLVVL